MSIVFPTLILILLTVALQQSLPTVTIAITTYNKEKYVEKAFRSVIDQSHANYIPHILLIDDASSD